MYPDPDLGFKSPDPDLSSKKDLNDGFDEDLEKPDQKETVLRVLDMNYNIFFYFYHSFWTIFSLIQIRSGSGSGLRKKV